MSAIESSRNVFKNLGVKFMLGKVSVGGWAAERGRPIRTNFFYSSHWNFG